MSILTPIRKLLAPPVFAGDEEKTRIAGLLNTILWVLFVTPVLILANAIFVPANRSLALPVMVALTLALTALVYLMHRGQVRNVSFVVVALLLALVGYLGYLNGGVDRPLNIFYPLTIVIAGLLLGGQGAIFSAIVSAIVIGIVLYGGSTGLFPQQLQAPPLSTALLSYAVGFMLIGALLRLATISIVSSLARARQDEQALKELNAALEQRVVIATRELALAAEVGRSLSQVRDLNSLLVDAVERIRQNFDLYYTQIYLVDTTGRTLVMTAGTGTVGIQLKQRNFRLPIGPGSLNGTAASTRQDVLVADTTQSATFRPNPLLPNTRSELAVPMIIGDKVVGVLDLQSERPNAFSEDNQQAFDVLAGLLAVSIQNNRLFSEAETVRTELEQQTKRLARAGWDDFLDAIHHQEVVQATYESPSVNPATQQPATPHVISASINVVGEPVGTLSVENQRPWSETEIQLVNTVAEQVARQIESVRLLSQAEQYRAEAEQTIRRYTREGWSTYSNEQMASESYEYDGTEVVPVTAAAANFQADLVKPFAVRGETIGEIDLEGLNLADEQTTQLLDAVSNQLSIHIENLRLAEQTQSALNQTETLYTLTARLNSAESITEAIQLVGNVRNSTSASLLTIEANNQNQPEWLTLTHSWTQAATTVTIPINTRFPVQLFPSSQMWIDNPDTPILYKDIKSDLRLDPAARDLYLQSNVNASVQIVLRLGEQWIGLLTLTWLEPQNFSAADEQLYRAIAAQVAVVVNNRHLFEQSQKRGERESIINVISQRIQSTSTVESALEAATREIGQLLKAKRALVEIGTHPTNGGSVRS